MQSPPCVLQLEYDALRRELNEWRDCAATLWIKEPMRSDELSMTLSGELEVIGAVPGDGAALAVRIDQIVLDLSITFYCIEHGYVQLPKSKKIQHLF